MSGVILYDQRYIKAISSVCAFDVMCDSSITQRLQICMDITIY